MATTNMSATYRTLVDAHGVLMNYETLALVMQCSPDGLRLSLARNGSDWTRAINSAKVKIGRRVLFRTEQIAALIDGSGPAAVPEPADNAASSRSPRGGR